jgi:hypothetical protein
MTPKVSEWVTQLHGGAGERTGRYGRWRRRPGVRGRGVRRVLREKRDGGIERRADGDATAGDRVHISAYHPEGRGCEQQRRGWRPRSHSMGGTRRRRERTPIDADLGAARAAAEPAISELPLEARQRFIEALAEMLVADLMRHPPDGGVHPRATVIEDEP